MKILIDDVEVCSISPTQVLAIHHCAENVHEWLRVILEGQIKSTVLRADNDARNKFNCYNGNEEERIASMVSCETYKSRAQQIAEALNARAERDAMIARRKEQATEILPEPEQPRAP
jgi:hypothetical protein